MYVRLVRFSLSDGKGGVAQDLADDLIPAISEQPGCKSAVGFGDDSGEGGIFVLWESEEAANAAAAVVGPRLEKHLSGNVRQKPERHLFRVIASGP